MNVDVLVVGAGPAGLAAAIELRRAGVDRVLVADREQAAGGVPRHCQHTGFGARDLHRVLTGPGYARRYAADAARLGAEIRTETTVTGWAGDRELTLTSPRGIETVRAAAVLLATGCRERPRPARLVPGSRVPGIMTTGELQQRVYLHGQRLPGRAVIVGAEHVSFSAVVTLAHAGAEVAGLVTGYPEQQSYRAFALGARLRWRAPVWVNRTVSRVVATPDSRLAGVELTDTRSGATRFVRCELLVFTGDWIPDHELARAGGVPARPGHPGAGRGHRAGDRHAAGVRGREPDPPGRDRGRGRADRAACRPAHRGRAGRPAGAHPAACAAGRRAAAALDLTERGPAPAAPAARPLPAPLRLVPPGRPAGSPPGPRLLATARTGRLIPAGRCTCPAAGPPTSTRRPARFRSGSPDPSRQRQTTAIRRP